jgi:hypothetical protein
MFLEQAEKTCHCVLGRRPKKAQSTKGAKGQKKGISYSKLELVKFGQKLFLIFFTFINLCFSLVAFHAHIFVFRWK